jgi:hypothetical protein
MSFQSLARRFLGAPASPERVTPQHCDDAKALLASAAEENAPGVEMDDARSVTPQDAGPAAAVADATDAPATDAPATDAAATHASSGPATQAGVADAAIVPRGAAPAERPYAEHMAEIGRRRDVQAHDAALRQTGVLPSFGRAARGAVEHVHEEQRVALLSLSQKGFAPRSADGASAIRVYGCFPSAEEAREHAALVEQHDPGVSLLCHPVGEWGVAVETPDRLALAPTLRDAKLKAYMRRRRTSEEVFERRRQRALDVSDASGTSAPLSTADDLDDVDDDDDARARAGAAADGADGAVVDGAAPRRRRLAAAAQLCGQRVAAISFVVDDTSEFLYCVHGCLDSHDEADAFVRNDVSRRIVDFVTDVVATCAWVFPATMGDDIIRSEHFRHEELDKIMAYRRTEPTRVREYREWLEETKPDGARVDSADGADGADREG